MQNNLRPMIPTIVMVDFFMNVWNYWCSDLPHMKLCQYFSSIQWKGKDVQLIQYVVQQNNWNGNLIFQHDGYSRSLNKICYTKLWVSNFNFFHNLRYLCFVCKNTVIIMFFKRINLFLRIYWHLIKKLHYFFQQ